MTLEDWEFALVIMLRAEVFRDGIVLLLGVERMLVRGDTKREIALPG